MMTLFALCITVQWLPAPVRLNLPLDPPDDLPTFWDFEPPYNQFVLPDAFDRQTGEILYYLGLPTYSEENQKAELDAIRAAFDIWESVPDTRLRFREAGTLTGDLDINLEDGKNLVFWAKDSQLINGGLNSIRGIPAANLSAYDFDGTILESDTVLNAVGFKWQVQPGTSGFGSIVVEPAMVHEIGHFIGLAHSVFGASAMFYQSSFKMGTLTGLSMDEVHFARDIYGVPAAAGKYGRIAGTLTASGAPAAGARVILEDDQGYLVTATVTEYNGRWNLGGLNPGQYTMRMEPFPPRLTGFQNTIQRMDSVDFRFAEVDPPQFIPTEPETITITAGGTLIADRQVEPGQPAFRITSTRRLSAVGGEPYEVWFESQQVIADGTTVHVGVFSPNLPMENVTLHVSHPGLELGETTIVPRAVQTYHLATAGLTVPVGTPPGTVTLYLDYQGERIYANGYLEIVDPETDANFDGLADSFQREFFSPFTTAEAGPDEDPDNDRFPNIYEYRSGTNPTDPESFQFLITEIEVSSAGTLIRWESIPSRAYNLWSRPAVDSGPWKLVASNFLATGDVSEFLDTSQSQELQFYRVEKLN